MSGVIDGTIAPQMVPLKAVDGFKCKEPSSALGFTVDGMTDDAEITRRAIAAMNAIMESRRLDMKNWAKEAGAGENAVNRFVKQKPDKPADMTLGTAVKLARRAGVSLSQLVGEVPLDVVDAEGEKDRIISSLRQALREALELLRQQTSMTAERSAMIAGLLEDLERGR